MAYRKIQKVEYEWFKEQWIVKKRLAKDIAKEIGCERTYVFDLARKYGLKRKKIVRVSEETKRKLSKINKGKKLSKETKRKIGIAFLKENNPRWKGGPVVRYDAFSHQIEPIEKTRRNPGNPSLLQVRCTYCDKWFTPKLDAMHDRLAVISGKKSFGEYRLYCSAGCKESCSIYHQQKYPKGFKKESSREVVPELRKIVFKRDNWECQKCGDIEILHCHHIKSYKKNLILANDPDNCITLCKKCHKWIHSQEGCKYWDLKCNKAA